MDETKANHEEKDSSYYSEDVKYNIPKTSDELFTEPRKHVWNIHTRKQSQLNNKPEEKFLHKSYKHKEFKDNLESVYENALPHLEDWFHQAPDYNIFNQFLHRNGIKKKLFQKYINPSKQLNKLTPRLPKYLKFEERPPANILNKLQYRKEDKIKFGKHEKHQLVNQFIPSMKSTANYPNHSSTVKTKKQFQLIPVFTPSQQIRVSGLDFLFSL